MSDGDNKIRSTLNTWLSKFLKLLKIDNYVYDPDRMTDDAYGKASNDLILQLVSSCKWAVGTNIEWDKDILQWIDDNLEKLIYTNIIEVCIVKGEALYESLKDKLPKDKRQGNLTVVLDSLLNSIIIVAFDEKGEITTEQMIRSSGGLSAQSQAQFQGQPIIKIKIPA